MQIEITINGRKESLTPEEARRLYDELHLIFAPPTTVFPLPCYPPVYPQRWTQPQPYRLTEIWCSDPTLSSH